LEWETISPRPSVKHLYIFFPSLYIYDHIYVRIYTFFGRVNNYFTIGLNQDAIWLLRCYHFQELGSVVKRGSVHYDVKLVHFKTT
jgi:hypothetical protein